MSKKTNKKKAGTKAPASVKTSKAKAKDKKPARDLSKCSKARVYAAFKGGEEDKAKLRKAAQNKVTVATVKTWVQQWKRGENVPVAFRKKVKKAA